MEGFKASKEKLAFLQQQSVEVEEEPFGDSPKKKKDKSKGKKEKVDCTKPRRHAAWKDGLLRRRDENIRTLHDNFRQAVEKYGDRPFLGTRIIKEDGTRGPYQWQTYSEVAERVHNVGAGLRAMCGLEKGGFLGLYAKNRAEWIISCYAANEHGMPTVALYDTFGIPNLIYVINHAELTTIVASFDRIQNLLPVLGELKTLKYLICMDTVPEDKWSSVKSQVEKKDIELIAFADLEAKGAKVAKKKKYAPVNPEPEDLAVVMYTSGTTGPPKGVMLTHSNFIAMMSAVADIVPFNNDVYFSYLPLAHSLERVAFDAMMGNGCAIGFYQGDMLKIAEDIQELKPTLLCAVPRVLNRMHARITAGVKEQSGIKQFFFRQLFRSKSQSIKKRTQSKLGMKLDNLVFGQIKERVGGRLRFVLSGGAPLSPEVQEFLRTCFGCPIVQGYGLTETTAGGTISDPADTHVGEIGPPLPCCEIKLVSVPEMNYFAKDNKGEIWIRGWNVSKGYYKDPEKTAEDFDEDGWFHTGDIGEFTERGTLRIIDRKKNIFKLAQGEYIAPEELENLYLKSKFVDTFIWVYGDSFQSSLVAVARLSPDAARGFCQEHNIALAPDEDPATKVKDDPRLIKHVLDDLEAIAKAHNRPGYEVIKAIKLVDFEFNTDNDLVTPTGKIKRAKAKEFFNAEIISMYKSIESAAGGSAAAAATATPTSSQSAQKESKEGDKETKGKKKDKDGDADKKGKKKDKEEKGDGKSKEAKDKNEEDKGDEGKKEESKRKSQKASAAASAAAAQPEDSESDGDINTSEEKAKGKQKAGEGDDELPKEADSEKPAKPEKKEDASEEPKEATDKEEKEVKEAGKKSKSDEKTAKKKDNESNETKKDEKSSSKDPKPEKKKSSKELEHEKSDKKAKAEKGENKQSSKTKQK